MKQRLLAFLEYLNMGQNSFEKKVGWSIGTVSGIQHGVRSDKLADLMRVYPELNIRWLLLGEGDMLSTPSYTPDNQLLSNVNIEYIESLTSTIKAQASTLVTMQELLSKAYKK